MKATKLNAAVKVIAKIVEVMLWIATAVFPGICLSLGTRICCLWHRMPLCSPVVSLSPQSPWWRCLG